MRLATVYAGLGLVVLACLLESRPSPGQEDPYRNFIASTGPRSPADEQKSFRLPPGFEIQLVASEPDIHKPMNLAFDDGGRLWVTESVEYPFPAPPDRKPRDAIKILEDTDGDGRADRISTFADGLNIPIGILPISQGAIVYSIPNIYRLLDTDGDGRADRREVLYGTFGSDDTHGMCNSFTWGFDGWIYAAHGFRNTSTLQGTDGSRVTMNSGNTFRIKPDGSRVEQFTHGQVNPFGLAFDPLGNLYSADCHSQPIMMLLRGGYYQSFGKPHGGLGFAPEICRQNHGSTGIAGIVHYAADHFPPAYRDTVFVGNVITNRINHDRLERHGSTLQAVRQADFLTSDDPWFRPVDIKLGPDGALYIADFYNRIIGHYEVPLPHPGRDRERGRIWRIVYRGADGKGQPVRPRADWARATLPELIEDLAHPNLVVRLKAANQLVERGGPVIEAVRAVMQPQAHPWQRLHGLWVLERLRALDERTLTAAAGDADPGIRVHAQRVLAERPQLEAPLHQLALAGLRDADALVQRAAADALGMHRAPENVRALLNLRHTLPTDDPQLLHTVRMALRNQMRPADSWSRLPPPRWSDADARAVADVATGVPSAEAASFLLRHLPQLAEEPAAVRRYVHHIARYGNTDTAPLLLQLARDHNPRNRKHQLALFTAIQQGTQERGAKLSQAARRWGEELVDELLASRQTDLVVAGIDLAGNLPMPQRAATLLPMVSGRELPEAQRRAAVNALSALQAPQLIALLGRLLQDASETIAFRQHLANTLIRLNQAEARMELLQSLPSAPASLQSTIAAGLAGSRPGAEQLLEAVVAGKASARLLQEWPIHVRLQQAKLANLEEQVARLTRGLPPTDQRLRELLRRRQRGYSAAKTDPTTGTKVFEKNCAICHQLSGKGTRIGPQLDGIGVRGLDRLLEDLLDPSRNVDQAFRSTTLALTNGQLVSGLVLREEGEVIVLADALGKEVRVGKSTVAQRSVSLLSPMPANVADQITEDDFYHLLAYLLAQRPVAASQPGR